MIADSFVRDWLPAIVAVVVVLIGGLLQWQANAHRAKTEREQLIGVERRIALGNVIESVNDYTEAVMHNEVEPGQLDRIHQQFRAAIAVQHRLQRSSLYLTDDAFQELWHLTQHLVEVPASENLDEFMTHLPELTQQSYPPEDGGSRTVITVVRGLQGTDSRGSAARGAVMMKHHRVNSAGTNWFHSGL